MMIAEITPDEFWAHPEVNGLINGYAAESHMEGLPPVNPDVQMYRALHQAGVLKVLAATAYGEIVGFAVVLISPVAHYSARMAVMESVYVSPAHRHGGTGWRLIKAAEAAAQEAGSAGLFISAPAGSTLTAVMAVNTAGYRHSNSVYYKALP